MENINKVFTKRAAVAPLCRRALFSLVLIGLPGTGLVARAQSETTQCTSETPAERHDVAAADAAARNPAALFSGMKEGRAQPGGAAAQKVAPLHLAVERASFFARPEGARGTQAQNSNPSPGGAVYVPPTSGERFRRYVRNTIGPVALLRAGLTSGIDQARDDPPDWRQGVEGYGKRFASRLGQYAIQHTVSYGLSEAMGLDDRFQLSTKRGFFPRLKDALLQNVTARTRTGRRVISLPRFAGAYAGGVIPAVTWYPDRYGVQDGLRAGTMSLGIGFGVNVLREFVIRR